MRRAWIILVVLAVATLAGPAQAQITIGFPNVAGVRGAKLVSDTSISARVQGELLVTFHGDPTAGCAAYGLCPYSGTIVVRPRSGGVEVVTYRRHGRVAHLVSVFLGSPQDESATSTRVTRSLAGATAGTCADAQSPLFSSQTATTTSASAVTIRLLTRAGSLLQTRCAGPTDGDLSGVSPATTISVDRLLRGRTPLDLGGSTSFATHGFAGTIDSTLTLQLGRPTSQPPNGNFPPGIKTQRIRTVIEQLSLVHVRGRLTAIVRGVGNPIVCGLLDSCGLSEALSLSGPLRYASGQLVATGPARRPYADFLAALGLSRTGRARGIGVFGTIGWAQHVHAVMTQDGSACTDTALTGGIAVPLDFNDIVGGYVGPWRTRCPGPSLRDTQPLLGAPLDRSAVGHREFMLQVRGRAMTSDDGYEIVTRGHLSLVLRRGRITQQVSVAPAG